MTTPKEVGLREAGQKTLVLSQAGLINDPTICIKNFGSTVACVCESCRNAALDSLKAKLKE
jgi:hypothetical protein